MELRHRIENSVNSEVYEHDDDEHRFRIIINRQRFS
jgi:hypothetical protein